MLLGRKGNGLALEQSQCGDDLSAGVRRRNHSVDVSALGGDVRVDEGVLVLVLQLETQRIDVFAVLGGFEKLLAVDESDCSGCTHDGDLSGRPCQVHVGAHVLGAHDVVRSAVSLAGDDRDLSDRCFAVRVEELRAATNDAVVFLLGSGKEAGNVDEDKIADNLGPDAAPEKVVTVLAEAKAAEIVPGLAADNLTDVVVVGCDSMLLIDGQLQGKPGSVDIARKRWAAMAGRSATLLTGHCVLRVADGRIVRMASDHSATVVHFAQPSTEDLEAYLATGEPLQVAGAFTLDSLGGWFVERIEGDPSSVIGIGLPLVRTLLERVGVSVSDLWRTQSIF